MNVEKVNEIINIINKGQVTNIKIQIAVKKQYSDGHIIVNSEKIEVLGEFIVIYPHVLAHDGGIVYPLDGHLIKISRIKIKNIIFNKETMAIVLLEEGKDE